MSVRKKKATDRYYIVSTGYTADDFVYAGEAQIDGTYREDTDWPSGFKLSWFPALELQKKHPAYAQYLEEERIKTGIQNIDNGTSVNITRSHAAKAMEARAVKFDGITDLAKLPYISAELSRQPSKSLNDIADEIWAEHIADADAEAARTEAKRNL